MHTLSPSSFQTRFASRLASRLAAMRDTLAALIQRWRNQAQARRTAQAFERLDDRTLRDLGFHRADARAIGVEFHRLAHPTLRRVIEAI